MLVSLECNMGCQNHEPVVQTICDLYEEISKLDSLKPSEEVNTLFTKLVLTCIPPSSIDVNKLCSRVQEMRSKLIKLCGEAECLLESHFSSILGSFDNPLDHLTLFPYYSNYLKLSLLEYTILTKHCCPRKDVPRSVAFLGSGSLPLTSIVLASYHLTDTCFHNYDIDHVANLKASRLVSSNPDLSKRMFFHTTDVMNVTSALEDYEVVFLAALVGMDKNEKVGVIDHLAKYMAPGAILMLRSAHGARGFLYPVIDPSELRGFQVLSVFHPNDDVINSIVVACKFFTEQGNVGGVMHTSKCCEAHGFYPLHQISMLEKVTVEDN